MFLTNRYKTTFPSTHIRWVFLFFFCFCGQILFAQENTESTTSSASLIAITSVIASAIASLITYFITTQKAVNKRLQSAETKAIIKAQIDDYFAEKEREKAAKIAAVRNQKINLFVSPETDNKQLIKDLKNEGFLQAATFTKDELLKINDRELIVFVNADRQDIIDIATKYGKKPRYFFYDTKGTRWKHDSIIMTNHASKPDTLVPRLTETLQN